MNWEIGVILFGITTFFFYTGTVIKWDQEGIEALRHTQEIGELLGPLGTVLTGAFTKSVSLLGRMYVVHVSLLPILFLGVVVLHLLLIRHLGISPWPFGTLEEIRYRTEHESAKPFTTHVVRLLVYGLVILLVVLALAAAFPPPLRPAPKEGIEITKPPWPFLWLLPLEKYFEVKAILVAFGVLFLGLIAWPFIERAPELDPRRRPLAMAALGLALTVWAALTVWGAVNTARARRRMMSRPVVAFYVSLVSGTLVLGTITLALRSGRGPGVVAVGLAAALGLAASLVVLGRLLYKTSSSGE